MKKIRNKLSKYLLGLGVLGLLATMTVRADAQDPQARAGTYSFISTPVGTMHLCVDEPLDCLFIPTVEEEG
tara:strand:- start:3703 stop:3915 length:213 start_codon:yes stop_codon:yes gene_type:complete